MTKNDEREYGAGAPKPDHEWQLRLYVTDWTPRCIKAYQNLKRICQDHVKDRCIIEVVDLLENPEVARREQIVAVPTLVKVAPRPSRKLVGDFSKVETVLRGLDIQPEDKGKNNYTLIDFTGTEKDEGRPSPVPLDLWVQGSEQS